MAFASPTVAWEGIARASTHPPRLVRRSPSQQQQDKGQGRGRGRARAHRRAGRGGALHCSAAGVLSGRSVSPHIWKPQTTAGEAAEPAPLRRKRRRRSPARPGPARLAQPSPTQPPRTGPRRAKGISARWPYRRDKETKGAKGALPFQVQPELGEHPYDRSIDRSAGTHESGTHDCPSRPLSLA